MKKYCCEIFAKKNKSLTQKKTTKELINQIKNAHTLCET